MPFKLGQFSLGLRTLLKAFVNLFLLIYEMRLEVQLTGLFPTSFQVRKRPLNKKEISRKEDDIVTVHNSAVLTVHEPKLKVRYLSLSAEYYMILMLISFFTMTLRYLLLNEFNCLPSM